MCGFRWGGGSEPHLSGICKVYTIMIYVSKMRYYICALSNEDEIIIIICKKCSQKNIHRNNLFDFLTSFVNDVASLFILDLEL